MKIVKIWRGKETVVAEGDRKKLNSRLKQLRAGTRGGAHGRNGRQYAVQYKLVDDGGAQ